LRVLAELHGKFDPSNPESADRSEDLLTSAVFGAIRHLPRSALARLLAEVGVAVDAKALADARVELWPRTPMPMWPGTSVEPDVIVIAGRQPVVFEAKLHSPFGLYRSPLDADVAPFHQLAVQYAAVSSWAVGEKLRQPVVVAVTAPPEQPVADIARAENDVARLLPGTTTNVFRWLPWWRIASLLEDLPDLRIHERALRSDVLAYMEKRGVRRVFKGFLREDYWLLAAAQRVAADRVYPQVHDFIEDLMALLDADGITWSTASWRAMWLPGGTSIGKPTDWRRGWMGILLWPQSWPERKGKQAPYTALYLVFDFVNPAVEVGFSIPGPGVGLVQKEWPPHLPAFVKAIAALAHSYELVTDNGDLAVPTRGTTSDAVDEAWMASAMATMTTTAHLRLRRRVDPFDVTVTQVRDLLLQLQADVESMGDAVWNLTSSVGLT
jgi:hypothetical protein